MPRCRRKILASWVALACLGTASRASAADPGQGGSAPSASSAPAAQSTRLVVGPTAPAVPARPHRWAWGDNKWTGGLGAQLISSGVTMAGGAGLAVLTEPRAHNETQSRFLHVVGIGLCGLSALSLAWSPISTANRVAKKPDAPLAPAPFFIGAGAIALGGGAIAVGALTTLGDEGDSPWDDARGVAIASGAMVAAFGVTLTLVGASDSGVAQARRPWQRPSTPKRPASLSLRLGAGSAFIAGEI